MNRGSTRGGRGSARAAAVLRRAVAGPGAQLSGAAVPPYASAQPPSCLLVQQEGQLTGAEGGASVQRAEDPVVRHVRPRAGGELQQVLGVRLAPPVPTPCAQEPAADLGAPEP